MTVRPWVHRAGQSALVIVIAGAGMVATWFIATEHHEPTGGSFPPAVAGGQPSTPGATSGGSGSRSSYGPGQPNPGQVAKNTQQPGGRTHLVVTVQPSPSTDPRPAPRGSSPPRQPPHPAPTVTVTRPGPTHTSTVPEPTPTVTRVVTSACALNLLGIKVCIGDNTNG